LLEEVEHGGDGPLGHRSAGGERGSQVAESRWRGDAEALILRCVRAWRVFDEIAIRE
jgi:hypothetical protein